MFQIGSREVGMILMSIDASEKKEQLLQLRTRVLQAEQERIDKTRVKSSNFKRTTLAYYRRILFTDFFSQSLGSSVCSGFHLIFIYQHRNRDQHRIPELT